MSAFISSYIPLDKNQLQSLRTCILSVSSPTIGLSAKQIQTTSFSPVDGYTYIPLTSSQMNYIAQCKDLKSDASIMLNLHQLADCAKYNYNENVDIQSKTIMYQCKKRLFKL